MDRIDLLTDPRYADISDRAKRQNELIPLIEDWMATFDTDEDLLEHLEEYRVPAARS